VGGRADLLAVREDERVAVEIETGQSDVLASVRNCLRSKVQRVTIVATDPNALAKIERELARGKLLVPGRVQVVLGPSGKGASSRP
jgi:hypothetical protein